MTPFVYISHDKSGGSMVPAMTCRHSNNVIEDAKMHPVSPLGSSQQCLRPKATSPSRDVDIAISLSHSDVTTTRGKYFSSTVFSSRTKQLWQESRNRYPSHLIGQICIKCSWVMPSAGTPPYALCPCPDHLLFIGQISSMPWVFLSKLHLWVWRLPLEYVQAGSAEELKS